MTIQEYPFINFRFHVQLRVADPAGLEVSDPLCSMEFSDMDGLEMSMEPKTVREGGNNTQVTNLVNRVTYSNITLKRGMTSSMDLWKWFAAATGEDKRSVRASGVVLVKDPAGNTCARIKLFGCLPIKMKAPSFNAKDGGIAIEEMQIAVNSFTVEAAEAE